jgi:hypothetical protein
LKITDILQISVFVDLSSDWRYIADICVFRMEGSHTIYGIAEERQGHNHAPAFRVDVGAFVVGSIDVRENLGVGMNSIRLLFYAMRPTGERLPLASHFQRPTL